MHSKQLNSLANKIACRILYTLTKLKMDDLLSIINDEI